MAKQKVEQTTFDMTVEEFCAGLSGQDSRVELIGAFHYTEKQAGHKKDSESNFRSRFNAFEKKPA